MLRSCMKLVKLLQFVLEGNFGQVSWTYSGKRFCKRP